MTSSPATTATFCATLVDQWVKSGVQHAVIAPGSRSTPMAIAIAMNKSLQLHIFHDERSASFAALGIGKVSRVPAILLCTSGTAAVEFHPAVVEANYAEVPMLVCTADRPPELQNVGAPQTIDQNNLYGNAVRKFHNAQVARESESSTWRKLANDLLGLAVNTPSGPIHLNLQFREPLVGVANDLPAILPSDIEVESKVVEINSRQVNKVVKQLQDKAGVVVAGVDNYNPNLAIKLAEKLGWPLLADPRSGTRTTTSNVVIASFDSLLRSQSFADENIPQVILRIGTPPVSKVANAWIRQCQVPLIVMSSSPNLIDPDHTATKHLVGDLDLLLQSVISNLENVGTTAWLEQWVKAEKHAQHAINQILANEPTLSEPSVARSLFAMLPEGSHLVVSSSMPIRDIEWFSAPRVGLTVHANRGTNGIDGVVSTAVGIALATKSPTGLLIGDLAMLHDNNGLINILQRNIDLRIVLVDNRGGGIFSFLPQATSMDPHQFELLFGTPHQVDFVHLAEAHGISATTVTYLEHFEQCVSQRGPSVTRIVTNRNENVAIHDRLNQAVVANLN